jgi:hypothetical protein
MRPVTVNPVMIPITVNPVMRPVTVNAYRVYYKLVDNQVRKKQFKNPTNNLLISVYTCSLSTNNIKDYS